MYDTNDVIASRVLERYRYHLQCRAEGGAWEHLNMAREYSLLLGLSKVDFQKDLKAYEEEYNANR